MGHSDSDVEPKKRDKDSEDSGDEREERGKERRNQEKEGRKERMDKEKEERKARMDREKEERKEKKEKEKERRDKEKEKEKERRDEEKERRDWEKEERKKHKEESKHGHKHREDEKHTELSQPSGSGVSVFSNHDDEVDKKAANYHDTSGAPPRAARPPQSEQVPWFLQEPDVEPIRDQRPQTEPDNLIQSPPPQYSFHPPQQQPLRTVGDVGEVQPARVIPPSGYRIPLGPNVQFPALDQLGQPPVIDFDNLIPIFIGSAILPKSVHPCRIIPSLNPPCRVLFGGSEVEHHGRYDLLLVTQDMEWVPTENGQIPPGRRPVEGGYESNGSKLYHALGLVQGVFAPGKAGLHLVSISLFFALRESSFIRVYREAQFYHLEKANTIFRRTTVSCE